MKSLLLIPLFLGSLSVCAQESFRKSYEIPGAIQMEGLESRTLDQDLTIAVAGPANIHEEPVAGKMIIKRITSGPQQITIVEGIAVMNGSGTSVVIPAGSKITTKESIHLKKEAKVKYAEVANHPNILPADKLKIKTKTEATYPDGAVLEFKEELDLPGGKAQRVKRITVDQAFRDTLKIPVALDFESTKADKGFVKFDEDKIWINPNLINFESEGMYYYQLTNRQTLKLKFTEWTVSALTLPIKYRFSGDKDGKSLSEEFTTSVNLNLFAGYAFSGLSKFHHREKVGNVTNTRKWTVGGLIGASTVTLNKGNTTAAQDPIKDDTEITKGLLSLGGGVTYSFNKINIGLFTGWDLSVGDRAQDWNYNKKQWLGIAVGYSLLSY
ncbi:hypothetical protein [Hymenobacter metallicola]|uniref:Outer membrane protein beta-barrel domain-containing protein n=1 Tax=Hymenobacter metallicola TaxID=2563114 RepID=A0A4Z0QHI6_9BACT|nr:hypothetical protein [Hymenobacter metallicola]TGE29538.1 hypothetical protein E5K02_08815 [Hymenobacter metallicola]